MTYRNSITGEIRELPDYLLADWAVANNPKLVDWVPFTPPPEPDPLPPTEVTNRAFRLAVRRVTGIRPSAITAFINSIPDQDTREDAISEWEQAGYISRSNQLLASAAVHFSITSAQLDQIFLLAGTL